MTDFFNDAWTSFLAYLDAEGGILTTILQIVIVLVLAWLIIRTVDKGTRRWVKQFEALPAIHPRRQRALTTSSLLTSSVRYIVWPIALIMVLSELNIDVTAMIATAGIAGLAFGFGAQTFVKDVISGIFLLFDDTIHVGDMVKIGGEEGTVEFIGIRLIKVRKFNGEMLMVPAGELRIFGNLSIGYARVIVEVGLSYEQDLETILPVLERIAHTWAEAHREILLEEEPQVQAVTHFADSSINARIVVQVQPGEQFEAERALRRMLKQEFDRQGIEIPFPRRTVYMREEKQAGSLPDTNE
ncbi:MAG: mechanosensitive ion channel family protein [Bacteroidetes bacterium]|nr:mechanosensitive ion channel family protein [Bacteroidota bacterium]